MPAITVLMPLPHIDFDPTEVSISWRVLRDAGIDVRFSTPDGQRAFADPIMISGQGLDPWGFIPVANKIKVIGLMLRADRYARKAYAELEQDPHFLNPVTYCDIDIRDYDGLLLPGGHAKGMRKYLEDETLQQIVARFFDSATTDSAQKAKPVAAVCHGVVLAARSISSLTGKSVLHGLKTTALPWAFEQKAWRLTKYFGRFWDPHYYRTYVEQAGQPTGYASVEEEVKRALASPDDFCNVTQNAKDHRIKSSGIFRDRVNDDRPAWLVRDGRYLSARWPGDVHSFAKTFVDMLRE